MTTRIEILSLSGGPADRGEVRVAFYYPLPAALAGSADAARAPAGAALTPAELQALKDGTLIEVVKTLKLGGKTGPAALAVIEAAWAQHQPRAKARHEEKHRGGDLIGQAWDGATWSKPGRTP